MLVSRELVECVESQYLSQAPVVLDDISCPTGDPVMNSPACPPCPQDKLDETGCLSGVLCDGFSGFDPSTPEICRLASRRERLQAVRKRMSLSPVKRHLEEAQEVLEEYKLRTHNRRRRELCTQMEENVLVSTPDCPSKASFPGDACSDGPVSVLNRIKGATLEFKRRFPE